jgi:hypothetical protein
VPPFTQGIGPHSSISVDEQAVVTIFVSMHPLRLWSDLRSSTQEEKEKEKETD